MSSEICPTDDDSMEALIGDFMSDPQDTYRRILDHIHAGGNIYYYKGRLEAYKIVCLLASNRRATQQISHS